MEEEEQRINFLNELSLSIKNEDHTIMNPIKYAIQSDFKKMGVEFCGYTIPHPSESTCNLVIQMKDKEKQTPENLVDVTTSGIDHLVAIVDRLKTSPEELGGDQDDLNNKFRSRNFINKHPVTIQGNPARERSRDIEYIHSIFPDEKNPCYIYPPGVSPISYVKKRIPYPEPGITPRKGIRYPPGLINNPFDHNHGYPPSVPHNPFDHGYPPENPDQDVNTKERTRPYVGGPDDGDNPRNKDLKTLYDKLVNPPVPTSKFAPSGQNKELTQIKEFEHEKPRIFQGRIEDIPFPYNKQLKPFQPSKDLPPIYILPVPTTEFPPSGHDPLHPYGYPPAGHDAKHPYGFLPENPEFSHSSFAPPFGHDPLHPYGYPPIGPKHSDDLPSKEIKPVKPPKTPESTFAPDVLSRGLKFEPFYPYGYPPPDINPINIDNPFAYDHDKPPGKIYSPSDQDTNNPPVPFPQFFTRMGSNNGGKSHEQGVGGKPQKIRSKNSKSRNFVSQKRVRLTFEVTKNK